MRRADARRSNRWFRRAAGFAAAASLALPAHGFEGEDVWSFSVNGGAAYDNNLLRLPSGISPSDTGVGDRPKGTWIMNGSARVLFDKNVSRQRFKASLVGNAYRYNDYSYLNWQGINYSGAWLWQAGNRWNGTLSYAHTRALSGLADLRAFTQNLRDVDIAVAQGEYWLHPRWRLTGGYTGTWVTNSADILKGSDWQENAFAGGFRFVSTQQNFVVFGARYARGDFPNRSAPTVLVDNVYDQYDVGVDGSWGWGGKSELVARVAYTKRDFPNVPARDFAGPTGRLTFNWRPTAKTGLSALVRREIGGVEDVTATYILTSAARVAPYWYVSPKVRLDGALEYQNRDYAGDPLVAIGLPQREDRLWYASIGGNWSPTRNWQLGLSVQYSTLSSNLPNNHWNDVTTYGTVQFGF